MATLFPTIESLGARLGVTINTHIVSTLRAIFRHASVLNDQDCFRLITGEDHPEANMLLIDSESISLKRLNTLIEPLIACGVPSTVGLCRSQPDADAVRILTERGYSLAETMPAMAVGTDKVSTTAIPANYELVQVGTGADSDEWSAVLSLGYGIPVGAAKLYAPNSTGLCDAEGTTTRTYAIRKDGRFVATSLLHCSKGVAGMYCVSTVESERGKGLGAHATAEPLRHARAHGYRVGVLQSSGTGHRMYKRIGFDDYGELPLFVRSPSAMK